MKRRLYVFYLNLVNESNTTSTWVNISKKPSRYSFFTNSINKASKKTPWYQRLTHALLFIIKIVISKYNLLFQSTSSYEMPCNACEVSKNHKLSFVS